MHLPVQNFLLHAHMRMGRISGMSASPATLAAGDGLIQDHTRYMETSCTASFHDKSQAFDHVAPRGVPRESKLRHAHGLEPARENPALR